MCILREMKSVYFKGKEKSKCLKFLLNDALKYEIICSESPGLFPGKAGRPIVRPFPASGRVDPAVFLKTKTCLKTWNWTYQSKLIVHVCELQIDITRIPEDQHLWGGAAWPSGFAASQGTPS